MLFFRAQSTKANISHANSPCHGIYGFPDWKKIYIEQLLPLSSLLFVSSLLSSKIQFGNLSFKRSVLTASRRTTYIFCFINNVAHHVSETTLSTGILLLTLNLSLHAGMHQRTISHPLSTEENAVLWEMEFTSSLVRSFPRKSLDHVSLRDIIYFLIWKDKDSKTQVHQDNNTHQGSTSLLIRVLLTSFLYCYFLYNFLVYLHVLYVVLLSSHDYLTISHREYRRIVTETQYNNIDDHSRK